MPNDTEDILNLPLKHFRAKVSKGAKVVERDGGKYGFGVVRGVSIITRGEALGHDLWVDADFLSDTTAAINAKDVGLKARFTHPGLSSDGLGKFLGKVHDAKTIGNQVFADLHFKESATKTPDGDLASYVMTLAEDAPEDFGISIVFDHDMAASELHRLENIQGQKFVSPDEDNKHNYPHARMESLRAADVVDSPAANPDGLFHRDQLLAQEAESLLSYTLGLSDERPVLSCFDVDADRVSAAVQRFLSRHNLTILKGCDPMPASTGTPEPEVAAATITQPTRETFASECKQYIAAFGAIGGEWYADGKSFADCQGLLMEDMKKQLAAKDEKIAELQGRLSAVDLGEESPAGFGDGTAQEKQSARTLREGLGSKIRISGRQHSNN